ncbi:Rap1a/Tai family immunity protein [Endozoicomonadaceae bacterium StTr2]
MDSNTIKADKMALPIVTRIDSCKRIFRYKLIVAVLVFAGIYAPKPLAMDGFRSAGDFYLICSRQIKNNNNKFTKSMTGPWRQCYTYTAAVLSTLDFTDGKSLLPLYCIPSFVKVEKGIYLTVNYLREHPESRKKVPALAILEALDQHYPCEEVADTQAGDYSAEYTDG